MTKWQKIVTLDKYENRTLFYKTALKTIKGSEKGRAKHLFQQRLSYVADLEQVMLTEGKVRREKLKALKITGPNSQLRIRQTLSLIKQ